MSGERTSSPILVGRSARLAELGRVWSEVVDGRAATLLGTGGAGIGKTRLVRELTEQVSATGADALGGGCVDLSQDVAGAAAARRRQPAREGQPLVRRGAELAAVARRGGLVPAPDGASARTC